MFFQRKQDDNETDSDDEELKNVLEDGGKRDCDIYKICQVNKDSFP